MPFLRLRVSLRSRLATSYLEKYQKSILGKKGVVPLEYFASFDDARVLDGRHEIIGVGLKMIIFVLDRENLEFGIWKSRIKRT